jgi:hypothetical protein
MGLGHQSEISDEIFDAEHKFPTKVIVFGEISHNVKSSVLAVESRSIDATASIDDFVHTSGMNG